MSKPTPIDDGGRAFDGMSLRDYFAGKCAQALTAAIITPNERRTLTSVAKEKRVSETTVIAHMAYEIADALITERKKQDAKATTD